MPGPVAQGPAGYPAPCPKAPTPPPAPYWAPAVGPGPPRPPGPVMAQGPAAGPGRLPQPPSPAVAQGPPAGLGPACWVSPVVAQGPVVGLAPACQANQGSALPNKGSSPRLVFAGLPMSGPGCAVGPACGARATGGDDSGNPVGVMGICDAVAAAAVAAVLCRNALLLAATPSCHGARAACTHGGCEASPPFPDCGARATGAGLA